MDIEKKIQILRACSSKKGKRCSSCPAFGQGDRNCIRNAMKDAATALSTLQAENEKLRAKLEQVKRECDEAVQCISGIAKSGRVWMCPYCVHAKDTTGGIAECELDVGVCMMPYSKFEWCSPQKED